VALFAPESTHRVHDDGANTAAAAAAGGSGGGGEVRQAVAATARGQVIVTAGYGGEIKVYENVGLPQWL
jgi:hypothetical protein